MKKIIWTYMAVFLAIAITTTANREIEIGWPPRPDKTRVIWLDEIRFDDLKPQSGFLGKIKRLIGGGSQSDNLTLPYDLLVTDDKIYMTCQTIPALVEIDREDMNFRLLRCDEYPIAYPIAVCSGSDNMVFFTDSEQAAVFKFDGKKVMPLIKEGLNRPTGITALVKEKKLFVIDTGDHTLKIFDFDGNFIRSMCHNAAGDEGFNFPTFAERTDDNSILVNDAMNYRIKEFSDDGVLLSAFGAEGDGPGTFARPKGLALDSDSHIWVVDNLFDNVQVFDSAGNILLVIGSSGRDAGQFWSPAGIDIRNDTVYIADTFNDRIQLLYYLGEE